MTSSRHIAYLDGWRGLAILAVLAAHFGPYAALWMGPFGVQLFFVLSGYLMGGLLFVKEVSIRDFFIRRASRVLPTFLLFIAAMAIYASWLQPSVYKVPANELVATLTFLRTYFPSGQSIFSDNWAIGHMWSLNVEEHSYIYLAGLALLARHFRRKELAIALLLLSVASIVLITISYLVQKPEGASPWQLRTESAALGLIASAALRTIRADKSATWMMRAPPLLPIISVIGAMVIYWSHSSKWLTYIFAPLLLAYSINHLTQAPALIHRVLSSKILCWFGTCSFSLYLWQQPFFCARLYYDMPTIPAILGAMIMGSSSFYFFENPVRRYFNTQWALRRTVMHTAKQQPEARKADELHLIN